MGPGLEKPASQIAIHQLGQFTILPTTMVLKPPQRFCITPLMMAEEDRQLSTMRLSIQLIRQMRSTMILNVGA
jgi:hypothetical protein